MPTLVGYAEWTPQQIKQSFHDLVTERLEHITRYHLGDDLDDEVNADNWFLDPLHPSNHPGEKLFRS